MPPVLSYHVVLQELDFHSIDCCYICLENAKFNLFLFAANRIVEVNDMWRQRSVELEHKSSRDNHSHRSRSEYPEERSAERDTHAERRSMGGEASQGYGSDLNAEGLKDEDIEQFLQSRYSCSLSLPNLSLTTSITLLRGYQDLHDLSRITNQGKCLSLMRRILVTK